MTTTRRGYARPALLTAVLLAAAALLILAVRALTPPAPESTSREVRDRDSRVGIIHDASPAPGESPAIEVANFLIRGRVLDAAGRPVPGAEVELRSAGDDDARSLLGETLARLRHGDLLGTERADASGRYAVHPGRRGSFLLAARAPGLASAEIPPVTSPCEVDLILMPGVTLTGVVLRDGAPVPEADVEYFVDWTPVVERTDEDGRFALTVPPAPGRLRVRVGAVVHLRDVDDPAAGEIVVDLGETGTAAGRVLDDDSAPVAGARVRLSTPDAWTIVIAGRDGRFTAALPAGSLGIEAEAPGFLPRTGDLDGPVLVAGETTPVEIRLTRGVPVRGRLVAPGGVPIAGAAVRIGAISGPGWYGVEAVSDAGGRFTIPGRRGEGFELMVLGREHALLDGRLYQEPLPAGGLDLGDVPVLPMVPLRGRVLTAEDRPVAGATVEIWLRSWAPLRAVSDPKGKFSFARVPLDDLTLVAVLVPGLPEVTHWVDMTTTSEVTLRAAAPAALSGRVTRDGRALPDACVTAHPARGEDGHALISPERETLRVTITDAAGVFRLPGLPSGRIHLRVTHPDTALGLLEDLEVEPGENGPVEVETEPPLRLTGRLRRADGAALLEPEVMAVVESRTGARARWTVRGEVGPDGTFSIRGLPAGRITVTADARGTLSAMKVVEIPAPGPVELVLATARSIRGHAVSAVDGEPVPGLRLAFSGSGRGKARTDASGGYRFDALGEGSRLIVVAPGENWIADPVTARSGDRDVLISVSPGCVLHGVVLTPDGAPLPWLAGRVEVKEVGDDDEARGADIESERIYVAGLRPGRHAVRIEVDGFLPVDLEVVLPGEPLRVRLDHGHIVTGVVVDGNNRPMVGAEIWAWMPGDGPSQTVTSAADGRFRISGLARGPYRLEATRYADPERRTGPLASTGEVPVVVPAEGVRLVIRPVPR